MLYNYNYYQQSTHDLSWDVNIWVKRKKVTTCCILFYFNALLFIIYIDNIIDNW